MRAEPLNRKPTGTVTVADLMGWGAPQKFDRKQAFEFIPTWQQGMDQPQPNDFGKYLDEG